MPELELEEHFCRDEEFDWFNPDLNSDDPMDEVLACTVCGRVKWTAREIAKQQGMTEHEYRYGRGMSNEIRYR